MHKLRELNIITDDETNPKCVIETISTDVAIFRDVSAKFAQTEGEGDKNLVCWRNTRIRFSSEDMKTVGLVFI
ncbi:MAG: hypothetical protein XD91_0430 [Clostridiales bacterium 38_11]|nr:MAG: hypothetical protein XD91_0430 [Clostridiales bacterium 38_11]